MFTRSGRKSTPSATYVQYSLLYCTRRRLDESECTLLKGACDRIRFTEQLRAARRNQISSTLHALARATRTGRQREACRFLNSPSVCPISVQSLSAHFPLLSSHFNELSLITRGSVQQSGPSACATAACSSQASSVERTVYCTVPV